jgi:hypothetical protein
MALPKFLFEAKDNLLLPMGRGFSTSHALTRTVDSINTILNLPSTPQFAPMMLVGGLVQRPGGGNDYMIAGTVSGQGVSSRKHFGERR